MGAFTLKKIFAFSLAVICSTLLGVFGGSNTNTFASSTHWNKAPKILKGSWRTTTYKTAKKYSNSRNRYWYSHVYIDNKDFHVEDFMLNKHKENEYNSGPYGAFNDKISKLAFQKMAKRHYNIRGSDSTIFSSGITVFSVYLSKSHKSMKIYSHNRFPDFSSHFGSKHYVGRFYKER